jgi:hypothetical protein
MMMLRLYCTVAAAAAAAAAATESSCHPCASRSLAGHFFGRSAATHREGRRHPQKGHREFLAFVIALRPRPPSSCPSGTSALDSSTWSRFRPTTALQDLGPASIWPVASTLQKA